MRLLGLLVLSLAVLIRFESFNSQAYFFIRVRFPRKAAVTLWRSAFVAVESVAEGFSLLFLPFSYTPIKNFWCCQY